MPSVNKAIVVGHVGKKPELKDLPGGGSVVNFSVATTDYWTDKDGQAQERTEWHRIVCFNRLADNCDRFLDKGSLVYAEGSLQTREWEDKDGNKRYTTEIRARLVQFLSKKAYESDFDDQTEQPDPNMGKFGKKTETQGTLIEDDVPF